MKTSTFYTLLAWYDPVFCLFLLNKQIGNGRRQTELVLIQKWNDFIHKFPK